MKCLKQAKRFLLFRYAEVKGRISGSAPLEADVSSVSPSSERKG